MTKAVVWSKGNKSGFKHYCRIIDGEKEYRTISTQYYNRTWEKWTYRSVISKAIEKYNINITPEDITLEERK